MAKAKTEAIEQSNNINDKNQCVSTTVVLENVLPKENNDKEKDEPYDMFRDGLINIREDGDNSKEEEIVMVDVVNFLVIFGNNNKNNDNNGENRNDGTFHSNNNNNNNNNLLLPTVTPDKKDFDYIINDDIGQHAANRILIVVFVDEQL